MRYVISDIHGHYDLFFALMKKIRYSSLDELYICGDVIEKGPDSVKLLELISRMPGARCIRGNHEEAFLSYYSSLMQESADYSAVLEKLKAYFPEDGRLLTWDLVDYLEALPYYVETEDFICVHAGVTLDEDGRIPPLKKIPYEEMLYSRRFKDKETLPRDSKCVFYGHTSSTAVFGDVRIALFTRDGTSPSSIRDIIKVHLDTGTFTSGVLGCFCVDTLKTYFVSKEDIKNREK